MSLPIGYETSSAYFLDVLNFLKKFSWIYRTANTRFIKENVLDNFPNEWLFYFSNISYNNLSLFPVNLNKDVPPKSIKEFQNKILLLKPNIQYCNKKELNLNYGGFRKINRKKLYEISLLAATIIEECKNQIDVLVDFGCGLGYLEEFLHKLKTNINIIGLESNSDRVCTANKRLDEYYPMAKGKIIFVEHYIQKESFGKFIQENITKFYPHMANPKIAIVGLHSCADLTNISMNMFLEIQQVTKLIIMPCCYHKLEVIGDNQKNSIYFKNFPLSDSLKNLAINFEYGEFLNRPFLRLACQQTASRWQEMNETDHLYHGKEMFFRGVVETIRDENEIITKRKLSHNENYLNLDANINTIKLIYELRQKEEHVLLEWTKEKETQIGTLLKRFPNGWKLTEALTCLQTSLQEICENFLLFDRICYMNEQSHSNNLLINCKFEKVLDDKLSPRCFALIAEKI